ncbi:MAG: type II toxin-antitoxin system Phd/YefM family antitoxin [Acidobacteria bacterium]|nr:type II toxin-antitoxin system Phd/YefM family antitoxin [Acidobacteriota bacterium]
MVNRIPLTKARVNLGQLVRRVHVNKEYFILEKDGIPVAGLMDAEELEDYLEVRNPSVREHIRASHDEYLAGKARPAEALLTRTRKNKRRRSRARRPRKA